MTQALQTDDLNIYFDDMWRAISENKCILLTGCGLSGQAYYAEDANKDSEHNRHPPFSWGETLQAMLEWCMDQGLTDAEETLVDFDKLDDKEGRFKAVCKILEYLPEKSQQQRCLEEKLFCYQAKTGDAYRLIAQIPFRAYLVTTFDMFIEDVYLLVNGLHLPKFYETSIDGAIEKFTKNLRFILKLHGDVDNPACINLKDRAFGRLKEDSDYQKGLRRLLLTSSVLTIGLEQSDTDLEDLLSASGISGRGKKYWMVTPGKQEQASILEVRQLERDNRISIIQYKPDETYSGLVSFLSKLAEYGERQPEHRKVQKGEEYKPSKPEIPETLEIFICCEDTVEDKKLLKDLKTRLIAMTMQHQISIGFSHEVSAGLEKEREIERHLDTAQIILLLFTPQFLTSEYCLDPKVKHIMGRHNDGARVIPIILRPCAWNETAYGKLEPAPTHGNPVTSWDDLDEAFTDIYHKIKDVVIELQPPRLSLVPNPYPNGTKSV